MSTGSANRITRLLQKHKNELCQVDLEPIMVHMVKRRVISSDEQASVTTSIEKVDKLIEILPAKGFNAFREFCVILEKDCPHLLNSLLSDANDAMDGVAHSRESSIVSLSNAISPKFNNRDLELMNKASAAASASAAPSSANSNRLSSGGGGGSTNGGGGGGSGLGDGIYNNSHIYNSVPSSAAVLSDQAQAGTVASGCEGSTKGVSDYGMHELLEEPVEEKNGPLCEDI